MTAAEKRQYLRALYRRRVAQNLKAPPVTKRKHCPDCGRRRLAKFFNLALGQPDGLRQYCRDCDLKRVLAWTNDSDRPTLRGTGQRVVQPQRVRLKVRRKIMEAAG